jgi:hypothetical protein
MALKLLKVTVNLEVKADKNDEESLKETVYEALQMLMESDELNYTLDEDEEEVEEVEGEE